MINIPKLIQKIYIEEAKEGSEVISHLPNVGETLYTGRPQTAINHLSHGLKTLQGKNIAGTLSQKVDGKVSILFGKENGNPYVQYKGSGAKKLFSVDEIKQHTIDTGKHYLEDSFLAGFEAAQHPKIDENHTYQADVMVHHDEKSVKGNIIHYRKPSTTTNATLAVHSKLDTNTQKKISSIPDVDFLNSETLHVPNLSMKSKIHRPEPEDIGKIQGHINLAKELLTDKDVSRVAKEIGEHKDEKNPEGNVGHRHAHFVSFANKVQAGRYSRSVDDLLTWTNESIEASKGLAKSRLEGHKKYIETNKDAIEKLLQAHSEVDNARNHIITVLNRSKPNLEPIDPDTGHTNYNYSEGFVSSLPGADGTVKFVPTEFTRRNNENKERFKQVKEEMSVGAGGIAGIGGPEDVAVPVKAQTVYRRKNKRKQIVMKFLDSKNFMV